MSRRIILPDTNCWRDPTVVTILRELKSHGAFEIAGYYPVAFECMTADNVPLSISTLSRLLETVTVWLRDKEEIISEVIGLARNDWEDELRIVQRPCEQEETLRYWQNALIGIPKNHAYWRKQKKDWQQKLVDDGRATKRDFDAGLRELHPDGVLMERDTKPIMQRCLDPNDEQWGGALLADSMVRRFHLTELESRKLLISLPRFPGFRLFYCHTMWNYLNQANGRKIDPSFVQDAHLLLPVGPSCVLLTKDGSLNMTHQEFFDGEPPLVMNESALFKEHSSICCSRDTVANA